MRFIDEAVIKIYAGNGGHGCISFRREKYVPRGGPDGGDGGKGGDIIFKASKDISTLFDYKLRAHLRADNGKHGQGSNKNGKSAKDLVVKVPVGTLIYNFETGECLADLTKDQEEKIIAKGGRGGKGNARFTSSIKQAPDYAQEGLLGEYFQIKLELKLLADVGLVGLPNAGKSTFLTVVSKARPKVADYPFTTLTPMLGVVSHKDFHPFTIADIPGLIENAHLGEGLGIQFLKHIERTKLILHFISLNPIEEISPLDRYQMIKSELKSFSTLFEEKKEIIVLTQKDTLDHQEMNTITQEFYDNGISVLAISSMSREGINQLLDEIIKEL
jgi:GTP-binding protein